MLKQNESSESQPEKKYGPFLFSNSSRGSCTQLHDSPRDLVAKPAREKNLKKKPGNIPKPEEYLRPRNKADQYDLATKLLQPP